MADEIGSACENSKLIDLIRIFPCIWDVHCAEYCNRDMAREAKIYICREMGGTMNEETMMKRYRSLRTQYVKYLNIYLASKKSGASTSDIKEPSWKYFQLLNFLRPCVTSRKGRDNMGDQDRNLSFTETEPESQQPNDSQISSQLQIRESENEENEDPCGDIAILLNQARTNKSAKSVPARANQLSNITPSSNQQERQFSTPIQSAVNRTITYSPVPRQPPSQQRRPRSPSQVPPTASTRLVSSIPSTSAPSSTVPGAPTSKKRKPNVPAEDAVNILQTLVADRNPPPRPRASETENDLFFKMLAKKVAKLSESSFILFTVIAQVLLFYQVH